MGRRKAGHFASFMLATMCALVVGKSLLLANALPFFSRFDTAPMIQPILFKTFVYWAVVFLVRFLEKIFFERRSSELKPAPQAADSRAPRAQPANRDARPR
jgi:hypothetical protein